jgi:hypothetical protein
VDHETALRAANQALSGTTLRPTSRFASVELRGIGEVEHPWSRRGGGSLDDEGDLPSGAWEVAAMASVAVATVLFVLGVWFL